MKHVMHKQFLTIHQHVSNQFLSNSSLANFPLVYILNMTSCGCGIFLWPLGVSCPGCAPSQLLVHLQPPP